MRIKLDKAKAENEDSVQKALKTSELEILQRKKTIVSLREDNEKLNHKLIEDAQKISSTNHNEMNHYRNMIRTMRDEIDQKGFLFDEKMQKKSQRWDTEFKLLQETIIELRSELEKYHGN